MNKKISWTKSDGSEHSIVVDVDAELFEGDEYDEWFAICEVIPNYVIEDFDTIGW